MDEKLLSSLDVAKISNQSAYLIMIPTISNLGEDPDYYNVSDSSRRARQKSRKNLSENLKETFETDHFLFIGGGKPEDIVERLGCRSVASPNLWQWR